MQKNDKSLLKNSFIFKISTKIAVTALCILIIFSALILLFSKISIDNYINNDIHLKGDFASNYIDSYLNTKKAELSVISKNNYTKTFLMENGTKEQFSQLLNNINISDTLNNGIKSFWVVSENMMFSKYLSENDSVTTLDNFDISLESWSHKFVGSTSFFVTSLKTDTKTGARYFSMVTPVYENKNTLGYCGFDISYENLCDYIQSYPYSSNSYIAIVSDFTDTIYEPSSINYTSLFNMNFFPLKNLASQIPVKNTLFEKFRIDGHECYLYSNKTSVDGWFVVNLFDNPIINSDIYKLLTSIYMIFFCIFVLVVFLCIRIIINNSKELKQISSSIEQMKKDNYSYRINTESDGELADISKALDKLYTEIDKSKSEISNLSALDSLTKIPNRMNMYSTLDNMIELCEKESRRFAMLFVDMDNFKWMNETLGHKFGDECLKKFAQDVSDSLDGIAKVFRFSGDEFVILADCNESTEIVNQIIAKLNALYDQPVPVCNDKINMRFSIGVAFYPDDDVTADLLLRDADIALHRAKKSGKDRVAFYKNIEVNDAPSSATIATQLNSALTSGELILNYQPIINLNTNQIYGFEVLARWNSSQYGLIPPSDFIRVAEETGSIVQIGIWVFENACRFFKAICEQFKRNDLIMSINVSPVQLKRDDYIDHIKRVMEITQLNPKNIQIEITESVLLEFTSSDKNILNKIRDMGILIALDDFGIGYSSLNYIKNYPFNTLKVDKSFVDKIYENNKDYAITDSIIDLVHNLGITTVAEGVETIAQFNFLKEMKCDCVQGFLVSKPLDETAVTKFIESYDVSKLLSAKNLVKKEKELEKERKDIEEHKEKQKDLAIHKSNISQQDTFISHN